MAPFITLQTARKQYRCVSKCGEDILPGQSYVRMANPAWEDCEGDVDDEGRGFIVLRSVDERQWSVLRFHDKCYQEQETYY